jgi:hypothetical protein
MNVCNLANPFSPGNKSSFPSVVFSQWRYPFRQNGPHGFPVFGYCTTTYLSFFLPIRFFCFSFSILALVCSFFFPMSLLHIARARHYCFFLSFWLAAGSCASDFHPFSSLLHSAHALWTERRRIHGWMKRRKDLVESRAIDADCVCVCVCVPGMQKGFLRDGDIDASFLVLVRCNLSLGTFLLAEVFRALL